MQVGRSYISYFFMYIQKIQQKIVFLLFFFPLFVIFFYILFFFPYILFFRRSSLTFFGKSTENFVFFFKKIPDYGILILYTADKTSARKYL